MTPEQRLALRRVKDASEAIVSSRTEFYEAVQAAAKLCTVSEVAISASKSVQRIHQIVGHYPHSRDRIKSPTKEQEHG